MLLQTIPFLCLFFQEYCETSSLKSYPVCPIKNEPNDFSDDAMKQINKSSVNHLKQHDGIH